MNTLGNALKDLLNSYSRENESDTPDVVLADFMMGCLEAFETAIEERTRLVAEKA